MFPIIFVLLSGLAMASSSSKKTKGRQKIEMKRIENEDERLITFSKRRSGIYKKASELVTLCGAQVAFGVFSPAGKPFSFGHPSVETVSSRFLGREAQDNDATHPLVEAHRQVRINELNHQYNETARELDAVKDKEKELKARIGGLDTKGWWDAPMEEMNVQELFQFEAAFKNFNDNLWAKIAERNNAIGASSSSAQPPPPPQQMMLPPSPPQMMLPPPPPQMMLPQPPPHIMIPTPRPLMLPAPPTGDNPFGFDMVNEEQGIPNPTDQFPGFGNEDPGPNQF